MHERAVTYGLRGIVASAHPVAALAGIEMLRRGGNAFDAAIAVAAAEGVLMPMMCGIGGDAFAITYHAGAREQLAFNGSGGAAYGATREYFVDRGRATMPTEGVHAVGVPGAMGVYDAIWRRYGKLPWRELWAPAISLAADGTVITDHISRRIDDQVLFLTRHPRAARQFLKDGRAPLPGERWRAPDLAESLRIVADGGAEAFYRGVLAERLLEFLTREGALFLAEDFTNHQTVVYAPIATAYRDVVVFETAPPSQGYLLLQQLNIVEGFDVGRLDPCGPDRIHLFVEAKRLAFADRNRYARDPSFGEWPLDRLISKEHAAFQRATIDPQRAATAYATEAREHRTDTSYFAVVDGEGNAVSFIHSLAASFGSGVVAGSTGITLNSRVGDGFSLEEDHPNVLAPGKRTMHTLNAYMVWRNGGPWLVGGTPGGDFQTQWNLQVLTNVLDYGMDLQRAVDAPRWFHYPGTYPATIHEAPIIDLEPEFPETIDAELERRGHTVRRPGTWPPQGAVQLVELDPSTRVLRGASDPRAGGTALGY